jgi:biotin carboxyl carrier protein
MARVTRLGPGVYRVSRGDDDQPSGQAGHDLVWVAGTYGDIWAFANGRVYRSTEMPMHRPRARVTGAVQTLTAPMPATVVKVLASPGQAVKAGDTLVVVEAMKMELPVRAPADAVVKVVHCKEKDIVRPDQTLVELE